MPISTYLLRRGDTFSFRSRVPADLCSRLRRSKIVRALGVKRPDVAKLVAASIGLRIENLWKRARMVSDDEELERLIAAWFEAE